MGQSGRVGEYGWLGVRELTIKQQLIMRKLVNHFWDWMFHPSIRAYTNPNAKASVYRYPSPGNAVKEPLVGDEYTDYKTPYEHTAYNVRYIRPTSAQRSDKILEFKFDSTAINEIQKLKKLGLLKAGEESNVDAVAAAKKKYLEKVGQPVEKKVYRNDTEEIIPTSANRQEIQAAIQSFYQHLKNTKYTENIYAIDRKTIDDPETVPLESVDMFVTPHFQQGRINNEYLIEMNINENTRKKNIDAHVGDARFWKAIDNSFDTHEVEKVQRAVGDYEHPNFELRKSKVELEVDNSGNVVDVHPRH